jgi:hypothetical protein
VRILRPDRPNEPSSARIYYRLKLLMLHKDGQNVFCGWKKWESKIITPG